MRLSILATLVGILAVILFIGYFSSNTSTVKQAYSAVATSTQVVTVPTAPATTTPIEAPRVTNKTTPVAPVTTATVVQAPAPQMPVGDITVSATAIRPALVNIICDSPPGSGLESISGSGVVIDPRGIILTNAHIGQYFLLGDHGVNCIIRTGSPAQNAYEASPAFVSPAWLKANSSALVESAPTGTGQYDIAILVITGSATGTALPSSFPYVPLAEDPPVLNEPVVIGSYAAQFLQSSSIENDLFPTIVYGSIKDEFTFQMSTVDVVSLGGSAAAQEGSSGGGIVDAAGNLTATITTSTTQGATSDRELDAITASYVRRDYAEETGYALSTLLSETLSEMVSNFVPQIPHLESIITADLPN